MPYALMYVDAFFYGKNEAFNLDSKLNQDNRLYCYWALREEFRKVGIELITHDMGEPYWLAGSKPEFIIYNDTWPDKRYSENQFLIMWECEAISRTCWTKDENKEFKKIFSWYPFKDPKYVLTHWPVKIEPIKQKPKTKELVMVCNNKSNQYYKEAYSKRYELMDFFGDRLDVFGDGYGSKRWKGVINSKLDTMQDYKFCVCLENANPIDGYATEKIIDAMLAGCIPIYNPNPNIDIPDSCYININEMPLAILEGVVNDPRNELIWRDKLVDAERYLANTPHNADTWARLISQTILSNI